MDAHLVINSPRLPPIYAEVDNRPAAQVWEELYWILTLQNKIIPHSTGTLNVYPRSVLTLGRDRVRQSWDFEKMLIASAEGVTPHGFHLIANQEEIEVRDYFAVHTGMVHEVKEINTADSLLAVARFYLSPRIDGNKNKKDVAVISHLRRENLLDFEYSDTMVRFKLERLMNDKLKLSKKVKLRHLNRDIVSSGDFHIVEQPASIEQVREVTSAKLEELYARYKSEYM